MDNKKIYIGLGIAAAVGVAYYFWNKKKVEPSKKELASALGVSPSQLKETKMTQEEANEIAKKIQAESGKPSTNATDKAIEDLFAKLTSGGYKYKYSPSGSTEVKR